MLRHIDTQRLSCHSPARYNNQFLIFTLDVEAVFEQKFVNALNWKKEFKG